MYNLHFWSASFETLSVNILDTFGVRLRWGDDEQHLPTTLYATFWLKYMLSVVPDFPPLVSAVTCNESKQYGHKVSQLQKYNSTITLVRFHTFGLIWFLPDVEEVSHNNRDDGGDKGQYGHHQGHRDPCYMCLGASRLRARWNNSSCVPSTWDC